MTRAVCSRKLVAQDLISELSSHQDSGIGKGEQIPIDRSAIEAGTEQALREFRVTDRSLDTSHFSNEQKPRVRNAETLRDEKIAELFFASDRGLHLLEILARPSPAGNAERPGVLSPERETRHDHKHCAVLSERRECKRSGHAPANRAERFAG